MSDKKIKVKSEQYYIRKLYSYKEERYIQVLYRKLSKNSCIRVDCELHCQDCCSGTIEHFYMPENIIRVI